MNTTTAATTAGVTVATIRDWARRGIIAATKHAGRWIIDTASLARRIAIGARKTRKARPVVFSIETMTAIGGNRWTRGDKDRVYLNDWTAFTGLATTSYNSGSIASAALGGRPIANSRVHRILSAVSKVYFDAADGQLHFQHYGADAVEVRYLDGYRETVDLISRITAGVRTAIAAL
jgi:hypothetical protein